MQAENSNKVALLHRLDKIRATGLFTWAQLATELELSRSMFGFLKAGKKPVSVKTERKLREIERRLGLRNAEAGILREPFKGYSTGTLDQVCGILGESDPEKIDQLARLIKNADRLFPEIAKALEQFEDDLVKRGMDRSHIEMAATCFEIIGRKIAKTKSG